MRNTLTNTGKQLANIVDQTNNLPSENQNKNIYSQTPQNQKTLFIFT